MLKSIKSKLLFGISSVIFMVILIIVSYSTITFHNSNEENTKEIALNTAKYYAQTIEGEINTARYSVMDLTQILKTSIKDSKSILSRNEVVQMISSVLENHKEFTGMCTCWEPNAFDNNDNEFINQANHDSTGRFIPYMYWSKGKISTDKLVDYETPGLGDWYLIPKNTLKEVLTEPYIYPIDGVDVLMTTSSVPIIKNNKFLGIVTADLSLDFIQKLVDSIDILEKAGKIAIISNQGSIAGFTNNKKLIGKHFDSLSLGITFQEFLSKTNSDNITIMEIGDDLSITLPIKIGNTNSNWFVNVIIPNSEIDAAATTQMFINILIGIVLMLAALFVFNLIANSFAKPIKSMTIAAESLSKGNTNIEIEINRTDEIGELSTSLSSLIGTTKSIINDINSLSYSATNGVLNARADSNKYLGDFKVLIEGLNSTLDSIITPLETTAKNIERISQGDIPDLLTEDAKGDFNHINISLNMCITSINNLLEDSKYLFNSAIEGNLNNRADLSKHSGEFGSIISGVNATLDRFVGLIDEMPIPVLIKDKNNNIKYQNKKSIEKFNNEISN